MERNTTVDEKKTKGIHVFPSPSYASLEPGFIKAVLEEVKGAQEGHDEHEEGEDNRHDRGIIYTFDLGYE